MLRYIALTGHCMTPKGCYNTARGLAPGYTNVYKIKNAPVGGFSLTPQKMRIYAKKVNRMLAVSKDYRIFANEKCVFTQKK